MNRLLTLLAGLMLIVGTAQAQTTAPSTESGSPDSSTSQSPNWNSSYDSYQTYPDESRTTGSAMSMDNSMVTPAPTDMDESTMTSTTASMDSSRATGSSTKSMGKKKKTHKRPGSPSSPEASPHTGTAPSSGTTTNPDSGSSNP